MILLGMTQFVPLALLLAPGGAVPVGLFLMLSGAALGAGM